jgi:flavin reductase (DIM6/NTAB) family NADH-FMN oxidoreductase RutF
MKIELPPVPPAHLKEQWEGQFSLFSYYTFTIDVPAPLFIVTTLKENGLANAALSAWGMPAGSGREPKFILTVHDYTDTRRLIERNGEFVVNYPSLSLKKEMRATVNRFDGETDEILASGLHHEISVAVKPPRVAECFAHLECRVDWMRGVEAGEKVSTLVMASVVHAALDDSVARDSLKESHNLRQWAFHISESVNPVNGAAETGVFAPLYMEHSVGVADFW